MKTSFLNSLIFILFTFSSLALSQEKVAVVDIEAAAINSDFAKKAIKDLNNSATFKKNGETYNNINNEIKKMQDDAKANGLTWSDEDKKIYNVKLEEKIKNLKRARAQLDQEQANVEQGIQKELTPKIEKIIPEIIKEKNIGLLINARAAYFRTPEFDITKELIDRLNKDNK
jgi:outer membrane protein